MVSTKERFWITLMLRIAFGFLFLFVALGQFDAGGPLDSGPAWFAEKVAGTYKGTWLAGAFQSLGFTNGTEPMQFFLGCVPFIFAALSIPILTGLFLRQALRIGALFLIMLGLGKYITSGAESIAPTAMNFLLAFLICFGLYFLGQEDQADSEYSE
jgi:hypothetical protein